MNLDGKFGTIKQNLLIKKSVTIHKELPHYQRIEQQEQL